MKTQSHIRHSTATLLSRKRAVRFCGLVFCCTMLVQPLHAGTLLGSVHAEGKSLSEADLACGKYDSRQLKFAERINYSEMRDFVVYIQGSLGKKPTPPEKPAQVITRRVTQKGAQFYPHVLPIVVGTTVEWPNNDEILHNVFSFSEPKQFDLGLYKSPEVKPVTFNQPGRVDVFCSIHTRMSCIVLVLENPFFVTTNDKGNYYIPNIPAGTYRVKAWHERLPSQVREITIPEQGEVKIDFTLGIVNLPKL